MQNDYREQYSQEVWKEKTNNGKNAIPLEEMDTPAEFYAGTSDDRRFRYVNAKHEVSEWMEIHGQNGLLELFDKNKKRVRKDKSEWVVVKNNHEPIIPQELWNRVREIEASVSRGKRDKLGEMATLSGFLYCDSCGTKMRLVGSSATYKAYVCGYHARFGKQYCSTHYIRLPLIEQYILMDIQAMIETAADEEKAKEEFLKRKRGIVDAQNATDKKRMQKALSRITELDTLIQTVYEDKVIGKIPEDVCITALRRTLGHFKQRSCIFQPVIPACTLCAAGNLVFRNSRIMQAEAGKGCVPVAIRCAEPRAVSRVAPAGTAFVIPDEVACALGISCR